MLGLGFRSLKTWPTIQPLEGFGWDETVTGTMCDVKNFYRLLRLPRWPLVQSTVSITLAFPKNHI